MVTCRNHPVLCSTNLLNYSDCYLIENVNGKQSISRLSSREIIYQS